LSGGPAKKVEKRRKIIREERKKKLKFQKKSIKTDVEKSVFQVQFNPVLTASPYFLLNFYFRAFL